MMMIQTKAVSQLHSPTCGDKVMTRELVAM